MARYAHIATAFVSTNSICQGEQTPLLHRILTESGIKIQFCHRAFQWSNEAKGVAAVHCIILGLARRNYPVKTIFDYETPKSNPTSIKAKNINSYLIDYGEIVVAPRAKTLQWETPAIKYGSMPIDNGSLIIEKKDLQAFMDENEDNRKFIRIYRGGNEFLYDENRYCVWLDGIEPAQYKNSRMIMERIRANRKYRESSGRE